ncbi:MAG: 7-cyano-7-deazaguanine synthase QueC [Acidobacteriota bacterium]
MMKAIVLFSGGIDSTTSLYWASNKYNEIFPITFDYSQTHQIEIEMAKKIVERLNLTHKIFKIDLTQIGASALTNKNIQIPEIKNLSEIGDGIPATYVPFRNGIFLSVAAAYGESINVFEIVCGFNVIDSPNYPDTREEFLKSMEAVLNIGTSSSAKNKKFSLVAPFLKLKKSELIKLGLDLGADYSYSISCYRGSEIPCFSCSSCILRETAWKDIGQEDHLITRLKKEGKLKSPL